MYVYYFYDASQTKVWLQETAYRAHDTFSSRHIYHRTSCSNSHTPSSTVCPCDQGISLFHIWQEMTCTPQHWSRCETSLWTYSGTRRGTRIKKI